MTPGLIEWPWSPEWTADGLPLQVERVSGTCPPHQHPFHEIALVASGGGRHRDADGEATLRAGDILVLHPQAWHAYPDGAGLHVYNCVFQPEVLAALSGLLAELGPCGDAVLRRHPRPVLQAPLRLHAGERERRELVRVLEQMIAERRGRRAGWRAALLAGLVQVLAQIGRLGTAEPPRALPSDERIDAARRWLAERCRGPMPSLPALAARFGLSPGHLSRRFALRTGLGVVAYVHQLRVEEACRLLAAASAPVTAVGRAVGYDDPAYFARIFARLVGCPPRAYRRRQMDAQRACQAPRPSTMQRPPGA
jgi:AraC family L-rhamnose operon transcriptional activator RhaR